MTLWSPQCRREALKLDIFKVKYDKIMKEKPKKLLIGKIFLMFDVAENIVFPF